MIVSDKIIQTITTTKSSWEWERMTKSISRFSDLENLISSKSYLNLSFYFKKALGKIHHDGRKLFSKILPCFDSKKTFFVIISNVYAQQSLQGSHPQLFKLLLVLLCYLLELKMLMHQPFTHGKKFLFVYSQSSYGELAHGFWQLYSYEFSSRPFSVIKQLSHKIKILRCKTIGHWSSVGWKITKKQIKCAKVVLLLMYFITFYSNDCTHFKRKAAKDKNN